MLDIQLTIENEKIILHNLEDFAEAMPAVVERGMVKIAKGVHREAFDRLSGPGRTQVRMKDKRDKDGKIVKRKTRARGQADMIGAAPGSYPVPVLSGNLRRLLNWLKPGESKTSGGMSFSAGPMEVVVYDSAAYALSIFDGTGSSAKFGPRQVLTDALEAFNEGNRIVQTIDAEIAAEIEKRDL